MMLLAAVHVSPALTVPIALGAAAVIVWYGIRLEHRWSDRGRRRLRQVSLIPMLLSLPALVRGLSFSDPELDPQQYLLSWTAATMLLLILALIAGIDAIVTLRAHRRHYRDALHKVGEEIVQAARARQEERLRDAPPDEGDVE
jgi:hypothetical protein